MSIKETKANPENGWGMPFVYFWDSGVIVQKLDHGFRMYNGTTDDSWMERLRNWLQGLGR